MQRYGDQLISSGSNYGGAILYFARGSKSKKVEEVIHNLVTISLIQSAAYPRKENMDTTLKQFLKSPMQAVSLLHDQDFESGQFLSNYLSGYAAIRKYFDLRDEELDKKHSPATTQERLDQAAAAIIAAITSAADSIQGGLLDPSIPAVIPIDNLLMLLGESLAFINRKSLLVLV